MPRRSDANVKHSDFTDPAEVACADGQLLPVPAQPEEPGPCMLCKTPSCLFNAVSAACHQSISAIACIIVLVHLGFVTV